jgi:hypothetical protein
MSEKTATAESRFARIAGPDLGLLASLESPEFEKLVQTAVGLYGVPFGALVQVADERVWFCSRVGFPEATTAREGTLWDAAMAAEAPFVVHDLASDPRFVSQQHDVGGVPIRFFLSCVFRDRDRRPVGVLCVAGPDAQESEITTQSVMTGMASYIENAIAAAAELNRAAEVQRALLPRKVPTLPGYEVAGACLPARFVGGDFFDWYAIEGGMAFTVADVMGKGVGAGIIAATVRATVRTARDDGAAVAVERAGTALVEDLRGAASFATLFHARLNAADGHISYVDAGHGLTVVLDANGSAQRLSSSDLPLGTSFDATDPRQEQHIVLEEGGTLVSFTDGVLDLYDGSLAAVDHIADIARGASSAQEIVDQIANLARREKPADDVTVVVIKRLNR